MALPPPSGLELIDGDRVVGWIADRSFGFGGFGSEAEAAGAAWVAYRSVARRLAQRAGKRQIPIDVEPLTLTWQGDRPVILASNREIAALVPPGRDGRTDANSFGFELEVPGSADELTLRSLSHMVYRTLRRSGVRWTMWLPDPVRTESRSRVKAVDALVPTLSADGRQDRSTDGDHRAAPKRRRLREIASFDWRGARRVKPSAG
jgi:hypothetical protein